MVEGNSLLHGQEADVFADAGYQGVKRQLGHVKVRYRWLKKNTAQLVTLFGQSNLWLLRHALMALDGQVRPQQPKTA